MDKDKAAKDMMALAHGFATIAMSKPKHEREAYLQECRANFKAEALSETGNEEGSEGWADIMDRTVRGLVQIIEQGGAPEGGRA
ncbi:hypothetical protein [Dongia sp.]|uniref:hypothetical protein n=1 Tax=Dongia sp. TaxID=1977262 RepID=UPI003750C9F1